MTEEQQTPEPERLPIAGHLWLPSPQLMLTTTPAGFNFQQPWSLYEVDPNPRDEHQHGPVFLMPLGPAQQGDEPAPPRGQYL